MKNITKRTVTAIVFSALTLANNAFASGGDMPWNTVVDSVRDSLQNGFVQSAAVIAIIVTGLMIAFGEGGGWVSTLTRVVFGLALALGAASFVSEFFDSGSGVLF
jgi:type IV secretion system protein VirB2